MTIRSLRTPPPSAAPSPAAEADEPRRWLVCYDIRDPRRLARFSRRIARVAQPLQYSVYLMHGTRRTVRQQLDALSALLDLRQDDLRAYPVGLRARIWSMGTQFSDGGNPLLDGLLAAAIAAAAPASADSAAAPATATGAARVHRIVASPLASDCPVKENPKPPPKSLPRYQGD